MDGNEGKAKINNYVRPALYKRIRILALIKNKPWGILLEEAIEMLLIKYGANEIDISGFEDEEE